MKNNLKTSLYLILIIITISCSSNKNIKNPNIIYIMADDLGYKDLGCYGQKKIITPNIDKLARNGIKFTQFYSASSMCAPSRCGLLTGKHMGHASIRHNQLNGEDLKEKEFTIGNLLQKKGYKTAIIGKWGVGHNPDVYSPIKHGFDYQFGYINMWHAHNYYPEFLFKNGKKIRLNNKVKRVPNHQFFPQYVGWAYEKHEYSHYLFEKEALNFIYENRDNPFFLYFPLPIPHENGEASLFEEDDRFEVPSLGQYNNMPWSRDAKGKAAMISILDSTVGKIIEKLKELNIYNNTIIIFTSDNGGKQFKEFNSNGELRGGKGEFYEGGIRVPFILQWPNAVAPNGVSNHVAAFWDVMPTLAEIVGYKEDINSDGISFLPTLVNKTQKKHKWLYWELPDWKNFAQAVRKDNWKGIRFLDYKKLNNKNYKPKLELYNLSTDISEQNNVAEQYPDIVKDIERIMDSAHTNHPSIKIPKFKK